MRADRALPRATAKHLSRRALVVGVMLAPLVLAGTSCRPLPPDGLSIVFLKTDWEELHLGYAATPALETLRSVSLTDPLFQTEPADVESYRWSSGTLVLTPDATARLLDALAQADAGQETPAKLNRLKERLGEYDDLANALYLKPFVVMLGKERLYGGIFLERASQMAIDFPVARIRIEDKRAVLHLLPVHIPFHESDPGMDPTASHDQPADVPPQMVDRFLPRATSTAAVDNRKLLQDERLQAWLSAAGKLR